MTKQKTLVILTPGFPANEDDTTCLPPRQIFVKALKENNPDLKVIVLAFQYPFFRSTYQWHKTTVISFNGRNKRRFKRLLAWLQVWQVLKKTVKENEVIGILSFWMGECALIGERFSKKYSLKHFIWILGQDAKPGNRYFKIAKPKAESLIALSDFIAAQVKKNYDVIPVHTIPVGIDAGMFNNDKEERSIDILGAGSLIKLKQFDVFINVVQSLSKFFPNIKAVVCGKGPEKNNLQKQIKRFGLCSNISLTGELPNYDLLSLMQQTKVFLHTSNYEGFGTVCVEALYAGAHVVSFCKPMNADIKRWHIVNSKEEMTEKTAAILNDPDAEFSPVLPYSINYIARAVIDLFI